MALDLQQAGGVVGAFSVGPVVEEFADPIEEGIQLAYDRREFSVRGSAPSWGWGVPGCHAQSLVQNEGAGHLIRGPGGANPTERQGSDR